MNPSPFGNKEPDNKEEQCFVFYAVILFLIRLQEKKSRLFNINDTANFLIKSI